jgi:hypothetical protein
MRTLSRLILALALGVFSLIGAGCGKSEPLYPVSGKVTLNNAPLKGGVVTFIPDDSKGNKSKFSPTGKIESDGKYSLTTDGKTGAPAGHYKVIVNTQTPGMGMTTPGDPSKPAPLTPQGPQVDPKYSDVAKTPITKEVVASGAAANHYDFSVQ